MKLSKKFTLAIAASLASVAISTAASAATYVYVGSWKPADGARWTTNPLAYSGVGAAALLFGGSASDYAISTVDNNPLDINHMANYEEIGIGSKVFADTFFRGTEGITHYKDVYAYNPAIDTVSTYVSDFGNQNVNYAFRIVGGAVPEPASWALMLTGFGLAGVAMRRRRVSKAQFA